MTLILTAICEDDICVCADTRYEDKKWPEGFRDGFDKIHKFNLYPLIIFNHGVNQFNGRYWDSYCQEYENSGGWKGKNLDVISEEFKKFIEPIVKQQLNFNIEHWPSDSNVRKSGFVVCGKNNQNNRFEIYELFWEPQFKLPETYPMYPWSGEQRLNGFGTGYDNYLKDDLNRRTDTFVNWNTFNKRQIKGELERLFSIARDRKKAKEKEDPNGGKEFSDDFIIKSVME